MTKNLFYFSNLNIIGGIEQFFAYLAEKYKTKDITVVYKAGDVKQIRRLRRWVKVIKFDGTRLACKKAFFCFNTDIRDYIDAEEYNLLLHGDYKAMVEQGQLSLDCYIFKNDFDHYYGVSQVVCDSWEAVTGKHAELIYNPFVSYPKKKLFRLVYCGRLSPEKGGDLVNKLIKRMDERNIDFQLFVYSNVKMFGDKHIVYMDTRLDAGQFLTPENYDYVLVLSKNEGYCYSLVQALNNGLPAIVTPCPVFKEIGVNKDNSILLDFFGNNIDEVIDKMISSKFSFSYKPKQDTWDKILAPGKSTYNVGTVPIEAISSFIDLELNEQIEVGEIYDVSPERAKAIVEKGFAKYVEVDL